MNSRRFSGTAGAWILLLVYASLYPFAPLRLPMADSIAAAFGSPRYVTTFDVVVNVLAYAPLGMLMCGFFLRDEDNRTAAIFKAIAFGAGFSFAMETAQLFIPGRISSLYDTIANTFGTALGALAFADPFYAIATGPLGRAARRAHIIPGHLGRCGPRTRGDVAHRAVESRAAVLRRGQHRERHRHRGPYDPAIGGGGHEHLGLRTFRLGAAGARPGGASRHPGAAFGGAVAQVHRGFIHAAAARRRGVGQRWARVAGARGRRGCSSCLRAASRASRGLISRSC